MNPGKIFDFLKKECQEILPAFIFFALMFTIVLVTRALTLEEYGITPHASATAVIGALLVSKAILLADRIPYLNLYPKFPLFWNVLLKTVVFSLLTFLFLFIEEWIRQVHKHQSVAEAFRQFSNDVVWLFFWSSEIWIAVLLLFYCAGAEFFRAVGVDKAKEIFFLKRKPD
jgi:hypothetical protein